MTRQSQKDADIVLKEGKKSKDAKILPLKNLQILATSYLSITSPNSFRQI
jgi:hypothetical protein